MNDLIDLLGWIGGLVFAAGYIAYIFACRKDTRPNLASWWSWVASSVVAFGIQITSNFHTWNFALLCSLDVVFCLTIIWISRGTGLLSGLPVYQKSCMWVAIAAVLVKLLPINQAWSIGICGLISISYIPTFQTAWTGRSREPIIPWCLWLSALWLTFIGTLMTAKTTVELVLPGLSLIGHNLVLLAILRYRSVDPTRRLVAA